MTRLTTCAALAAITFFGVSSCGGDDLSGGDLSGGDTASESTDGGSGDMSDDTVVSSEFETDEGSYATGDAAEIPDDFPSEVPLPEEGGPSLVGVFTDSTTWLLTFEMDDTSQDVCEGYLDSFGDAGFNEDGRFESSGDYSGIFSSSDYAVVVGCGSTGGVSVQVSTNEG